MFVPPANQISLKEAVYQFKAPQKCKNSLHIKRLVKIKSIVMKAPMKFKNQVHHSKIWDRIQLAFSYDKFIDGYVSFGFKLISAHTTNVILYYKAH